MIKSPFSAFVRASSRRSHPPGLYTRRCFSSLRDLRPKALIEVTPMGRLANLVPPRRGREIIQRVGSTYGGTHSLTWITPASTALFVVKKCDSRAHALAKTTLRYMTASRPELSIVVEEDFYSDLDLDLAELVIPLRPYDTTLLGSRIDFVVALGGDGTLLRVASLFDGGPCPPILGCSMGSLGFLMPIALEGFTQALDDLVESRASMLLRMRLQCVVTEPDTVSQVHTNAETSTIHAMNEVTLHRGNSPHLIRIDTKVDGEHLTEVVADGLLLSTPTGSTAYSLSAGGPIVHPSVQSLLLTAISPRSLSFRTVLLPSDVSVSLSLAARSRGTASLSLDGHEIRTLLSSQTLTVSMSPYPVPCISKPLSRLPASEETKERDAWLADIRRMLKFNAPFSEGRVHAE